MTQKNKNDVLFKFLNHPISVNVISGVILMLIGFVFVTNEAVQEVLFNDVIPIVVPYNQELQNQAAMEVISNKCPALTEFTKDYSVMRDQVRLLEEELQSCKIK